MKIDREKFLMAALALGASTQAACVRTRYRPAYPQTSVVYGAQPVAVAPAPPVYSAPAVYGDPQPVYIAPQPAPVVAPAPYYQAPTPGPVYEASAPPPVYPSGPVYEGTGYVGPVRE